MTTITFNGNPTEFDFPFSEGVVELSFDFVHEAQGRHDMKLTLKVSDLTINRKDYGNDSISFQHYNGYDGPDPYADWVVHRNGWTVSKYAGYNSPSLTDSAKRKLVDWIGYGIGETLYKTYRDDSWLQQDKNLRAGYVKYTHEDIAKLQLQIAKLQASLESLDAWQKVNESNFRLDEIVEQIAKHNGYYIVRVDNKTDYARLDRPRYWDLRKLEHQAEDRYGKYHGYYPNDARLYENSWLQGVEIHNLELPESVRHMMESE